MPDMNFDAYARQRAQSLVDALTKELAGEARTQLDALRAAVDAQIGSLRASLAQNHDVGLDRVVKELTEAASKETEARLTVARTEANTQIEAARAANAALLAQIEEARAELRTARETAQHDAERARTEFEAHLAQAKTDQASLSHALADAEREVHAVRSERDALATRHAQAEQHVRAIENEQNKLRLTCEEAGKLLDVQTKRASELAAALETSKGETNIARMEAEAERRDLDAANHQVAALEKERRRLESANHDQKAALESARKKQEAAAKEHTAALDAERRNVELARKERAAALEGDRRKLEAAAEQIAALQAECQRLRAGASAKEGRVPAAQDNSGALLDRVADALQSLRAAGSSDEILEILIEQLSIDFDKAAIFLAGAIGVKGWRGRGFGEGTDLSAIVVPRASDSPLIRAMDSRQPVDVEPGAAGPLVGLSHKPIARALALPVVANGRVIAIAYAESTEPLSKTLPDVGYKVATILIEQASRRLTMKRRSGSDSRADSRQGTSQLDVTPDTGTIPAYSVKRQAPRVKMQEGVNVTLDGSASFLIDLSTLGAQVLSPVALRPKRVVKLTLVIGDRTLDCTGMIVWALFEQPKGTAAALYRAGVQFTEVDSRAVEAFLAAQGISRDSSSPSYPAALKGTA